jgi:hypothetical protein
MKIAILDLSCHVMSCHPCTGATLIFFTLFQFYRVSLNSERGSKLVHFNLVFKQVQEFQAIHFCCRMSPTSLRYNLGYGFSTS